MSYPNMISNLSDDSFDTVIVGAGIAGLVFAVRLAELGLKVAVLEKGDHDRYPCNTRFTGGAFHVGFHSVNEDEKVLLDAINERTHGFANPEIAKVVAAEARNAVGWLKSKGIRFVKGGAAAWRGNTLTPALKLKPGLHWEGRGGDVLLRTLASAFKDLGGTLLLDTRALKLRMQNGRCIGVDAEHRGQGAAFHAQAVALCDGGFQANHDLLREFITPAPEKLKQRGAAVGNGDALRMAREVGARLVGMDRFYGHVLCQDAMHNDQLWPFPMLDYVCAAGVVVDAAGRRFVDEGMGGVFMTNAIARLPDPLSATVVFDEVIWSGPGREYLIPANPNVVAAGATLLKDSGLAGLARQLAIAPDDLAETIAHYNAAVDAGTTASIAPARTAATHKPYPVRQPPFYAIRLCAGITSTMGGIAIDGRARVLNEQNTPIDGLYAVGCSAGGLEGGPMIGYVGQLAQSASMALHAAAQLAAAFRR